MATIRLEHIAKTYPGAAVPAVASLDLEVNDGEFVVLVGPSGSGKSTTLRLVAGLEHPTGGRILLGGRDITALPPQARDLAMVFQSYALYPHKTVRQNLAFPLRMQKQDAGAIDARVSRVAEQLGIGELLERKPRQLSGGQRQRVALGRAMVREPRGFLLDEPLSNLDARLRVETRTELARMQRRLGATMLYVTHDQEEAMTLSDRVAVMHQGRLQQYARPMEVYRRPANRFVAGFIGSPAMNFFPGALVRRDGRSVFQADGWDISLDQLPAAEGPVTLGVRPSDIRLTAPGEGDIDARVDVAEPLGREVLLHLGAAGIPALRVLAPADSAPEENTGAGLRFQRDHLHFFAHDNGQRLS